MPIYEFECPMCGNRLEKFVPLYISKNKDSSMHCGNCDGEMDMIFSVSSIKTFKSYITKHILPHGKPVEVTSERHESSLLRENGLCKADSNPTK